PHVEAPHDVALRQADDALAVARADVAAREELGVDQRADERAAEPREAARHHALLDGARDVLRGRGVETRLRDERLDDPRGAPRANRPARLAADERAGAALGHLVRVVLDRHPLARRAAPVAVEDGRLRGLRM